MLIAAFALAMVQPGEIVQPLDGAGSSEGKETSFYWQKGGWNIIIDTDKRYCMLSASYKSGRFFSVFYKPKDKNVTLYFTDPNSTSLQDGEKKNLQVILRSPRMTFDDGWGEREFTVGRKADYENVTFISFSFSPEMLDDLAANESIGFFYNDKVVAVFDLVGSAEAIKQLRTCAYKAANINPKDVFAQ